jgi:hypothetical protein
MWSVSLTTTLALVGDGKERAGFGRLAADGDDGHRHACVVAGQVGPFEAGVGKGNGVVAGKNQRPQNGHLLALANAVGAHKGGGAGGVAAIVCRFHEPAGHVVQAFPAFAAVVKNGFKVVFVGLPGAAQIRRIAADIGLAAFVLEVDFRLIQRRVEQIIGHQLHARARGRADAQPIQPQGVAANNPVLRVQRQKLRQRILLPAIQHVALELGNDERQPRNLCRKVAQLDAAEVGQRNLAAQGAFRPGAVDLGLDLAHLLVGDDQEVALPQAGSNTRMRAMRLRRFSSLALVVACGFQLRAQVVQEQRVQHLQDVGHAGVVHAQCTALFVVGHGLDHAAEDVGVDLAPVQIARVQQVGARHAVKRGTSVLPENRPPFT